MELFVLDGRQTIILAILLLLAISLMSLQL